MIDKECIDYITFDIVDTSTQCAVEEYVSAVPDIKHQENIALIPPTSNHAFTKNEKIDRIIIHRRLAHALDDKIDEMTKLETIKDLPKRQKKESHSPTCRCIICWKGSTVNLPKGIALSTENLVPGQLIHMDFCFLEIESIRKFTCSLIIVDAKVRKMWTFNTQGKRPLIDTVRFFLTQLKQIGRQVHNIRTDQGGELARSSEFCNLLVEEFQCGLQTTTGYSSWLNCKVERHIRTLENTARKIRADANLPPSLWCFSYEHATDIYGAMLHSAIKESPDYLWYGVRRSIHDFRVWGCHIEAMKGTKLTNSEDRTESGYFLGTTATRSVIRYWDPTNPNSIGYCTTAKFNEYETYDPSGKLSPGSKLSQGFSNEDNPVELVTVEDTDHPLMKNPIEQINVEIPPQGTSIGLTIRRCKFHNLPYIIRSNPTSYYNKSVRKHLRHNVWVMAVENNDPITPEQVLQDLKDLQGDKVKTIKMVVSKRDTSENIRTNIEERWASFNQLRMIKLKVIDSDSINTPIQDIYRQRNTSGDKREHTNSGYKTVKIKIGNDIKSVNQESSSKDKDETEHINSGYKNVKIKIGNDIESINQESSYKDKDETHNKSYSTRLRRRRRVDYNTLANPKVNKLIQLPFRPKTPNHVGEALHSNIRTYWIECLFNCYDKMHNTATLSCPFLRSSLQTTVKILNTRLSIEVKITDIDDFYEIKVRMCANGSKMIKGIDFLESYAPTADCASFIAIIIIAASEGMTIVFIDASNAFQTNVISDPRKRVYVSLPSLYLEWFKARFPNHPLSLKSINAKELVMQTLRNLQGTKDAGFEWYRLLAQIFKELGWKANTVCKGVWVYLNNNVKAYLILATDDILYLSKSQEPLDALLQRFDDFFSYTIKRGTELQFLNFRIIQSEYGISLDQTNHIIKNILKQYFAPDEKVKYEASPWPLANMSYILFYQCQMKN